jgi:hypothetical protein
MEAKIESFLAENNLSYPIKLETPHIIRIVYDLYINNKPHDINNYNLDNDTKG